MQTMQSYKIDQAIKIIDTIAEPAPKRGNGGESWPTLRGATIRRT